MSNWAIAGTHFERFCVAQQHENHNLARATKTYQGKNIFELHCFNCRPSERQWPKVATEIQAAYSAPNQLIPVRAPCASCSYPPSPTIRSRPRSLMPCHRFYLRPSRYMYTILHHWYRKHANKIVKKPVANPRLPGITLAGSRDQSISPS